MIKVLQQKNIFFQQNVGMVLFIAIVVSVFMYLYFYQVSISSVATIETFEEKIANLKSKISESEFEIIETRRSFDKETALSSGFVEIKDIVFLKRNQTTALNVRSN